MGGNATIEGHKSEPITINMRKDRRKDIDGMLRSINRHSKSQIWGYGAPSLASGDAYSGSTKHMMDKSLDDEGLRKFKKSFGDVDVMIPKQHEQTLLAALETGQKHGKFTVLGQKKIGPSISAIVQHEDGKKHQVDFEFKDFDGTTQAPTDFSKFSQNASIDDMKVGVKGAAHKTLISALTARKGQQGVVERVKGGKSSMSAPTDIRSTTFSQAYGTRPKNIPSLDKDGKQKMHNGYKVYNELGSENAAYETNLAKIHEQLFGKEGNDSDVEKMHSFVGTSKLMKKHLQPHEIRTVINDFAKRLYDKRAATHFHADPTKDNELKVTALRELRKQHPEHFDKLMYDTISKYRENYYDKPAEKLKESTEKTIRIALAAGRFTGPTKEHEKLIDKLFEQQADYHYVYVMGPSTLAETTTRDPITVDRKVAILEKLYPEHVGSFISGNTPHTKTPLQAMVNSWHLHEGEGENIELVVVAGDGTAGLTGKDAGGSAAVYEDLIARTNGTKFADGNYRMNYSLTEVVRNPRGDRSGTLLREAARNNDFDAFLDTAHSRMNRFMAKRIFEQMRPQVEKTSEDLIKEHYQVIEYGAAHHELPLDVIGAVVSGATTVTEMFDRIESLVVENSINEDVSLLDKRPDTYVIMYHPEKLYYQVERINLKESQTVEQQPVIAERLNQGFVITSTHTDTMDPEFVRDNHRYMNRKYRRQIDD